MTPLVPVRFTATALGILSSPHSLGFSGRTRLSASRGSCRRADVHFPIADIL
jgi:hypothetical protein